MLGVGMCKQKQNVKTNKGKQKQNNINKVDLKYNSPLVTVYLKKKSRI